MWVYIKEPSATMACRQNTANERFTVDQQSDVVMSLQVGLVLLRQLVTNRLKSGLVWHRVLNTWWSVQGSNHARGAVIATVCLWRAQWLSGRVYEHSVTHLYCQWSALLSESLSLSAGPPRKITSQSELVNKVNRQVFKIILIRKQWSSAVYNTI